MKKDDIINKLNEIIDDFQTDLPIIIKDILDKAKMLEDESIDSFLTQLADRYYKRIDIVGDELYSKEGKKKSNLYLYIIVSNNIQTSIYSSIQLIRNLIVVKKNYLTELDRLSETVDKVKLGYIQSTKQVENIKKDLSDSSKLAIEIQTKTEEIHSEAKEYVNRAITIMGILTAIVAMIVSSVSTVDSLLGKINICCLNWCTLLKIFIVPFVLIVLSTICLVLCIKLFIVKKSK